MLLGLLFPFKCPLCGEVIGWKRPNLCENCLPKWLDELTAECPNCHQTAQNCCCPVPALRDLPIFTDEEKAFLAIGWYAPKKYPLNANLVYRLKHSQDNSPAWIFANPLASAISSYLAKKGENPLEWAVVYPPRTKAAIEEEGFDQAERLSRQIARLLGSKVQKIFRRKGGAVQKKLDSQGRKENARDSLKLKRFAKVRGRKFIVCDDIVTTGATVARCVQLLYNAGAEKVLTVSALRTQPYPTAKRTEKM